MKVAVVGGGSTYTPELVDGVARLAGQVGVTELTLKKLLSTCEQHAAPNGN